MAQSLLLSVPPFSVGARWNEWLDCFENFMAAMDIKNATWKYAMLIHCAGKEIEETEAKTKLMEHFKPQQNIKYECYKFPCSRQNTNETLDQYHTRLKHLASTCDFADSTTEIVATLSKSIAKSESNAKRTYRSRKSHGNLRNSCFRNGKVEQNSECTWGSGQTNQLTDNDMLQLW